MISTLILNIESKNDPYYFVITDRSHYNPNLPVTCGTLEIKVPGAKHSVFFNVLPNFSTSYNASSLRIQIATSHDTLIPLPDGPYYIKYSINPNEQLYVEYVFYNVAMLKSKYFEKVCGFFENKCDYTIKQQNEKIEELWQISNNLDLIKIAAEECNNVQEATLLYNKTYELINKYCD